MGLCFSTALCIIMEIKKAKNSLIITSKQFSADKILNSGQVFRFKPYGNGYILNSGGELATLKTFGDRTEITCTNQDYFYRYFDLDTDYDKIIDDLSVFPALKCAVDYGKGIRILKQDIFETIISFIISANNNIKRISKIIDNICIGLGEKKVFNDITYYAFPTVTSFAAAGEQFFKSAGAGYRAAYIYKTANAIANGFDINCLKAQDSKTAEEKLLQLYGIGKKVCDCILLFAYERQDVFPVDTWIEKVYYDCFSLNKTKINRQNISKYFVDKFGGLSGYVQQYLFYFKRSFKGDINYEVIP